MNETLLDRAHKWFKTAKSNYLLISEDDIYLNLTGYLLQQSVEFALKHVLMINGIKYPQSHDISLLVDSLPKECKPLVKCIKMNVDTLTKWEGKARYVTNYYLEKQSIDLVFPNVEKLLKNVTEYDNKVSLSITPQLSDNIKNLIWSAIPAATRFQYGSDREEIIANYYATHKELFEGIE